MPDGSRPPEKPAKTGAAALAESLQNAETRPRRRRGDDAEPPQDPPRKPPGRKGGGDGSGSDDGEGWFAFPKGGPVQPLGIDGKELLFIDANKQFVRMHPRDLGGHGLSMLYGDRQDYLDATWPRPGKRGASNGLDKERAVRSHIAACSRLGVFDSDNRIRGVGAWTNVDGWLIWHFGDTVLVVEPDGTQQWVPVGTVGDHVYPQGVPQVRPAKPKGDAVKEMNRLYELLQSWHWKRGDLDARLQLGWIGCALIGGALRWRPATWASGGQGTGKSTLHDQVLNPVLGGTASVVQTADATGPGLYQALKNRSTPVVFDELEPNPEDRHRVDATIKLAKVSASGARIVRGSPDGAHKEFVARAAFLFSSILIPPLQPELAMRIAILQLQALGDRKEPAINGRDMLELGAALRWMLVERWKHWAFRLEEWRLAFRNKGYNARVSDTWGTLLAMADHLLSPVATAEDSPRDTFDVWIDRLKPHLDALIEASGSDHARLLQSLLTTTVDPYAKGKRWPLSTLMSVASGRSVKGEDPTEGGLLDQPQAETGLASLGMRIMSATPPLPSDAPEGAPKPAEVWCLAVAGNHTEVNKLLRETKWRSGVYTQTLLRIPGAWSTQQRIARQKQQCTMIPLDLVLPKDEPGGDMFTT